MQTEGASSRVRSPVVEDEKACGENPPEGVHQRPFPPFPGSGRLRKYPFEHKHDRSGRHVAIVAQHCPRLYQSALREPEGMLERRNHLGASRVTDETIDIVDSKSMASQELRHGIAE